MPDELKELDSDIIAIAFEWAIPEGELNLMVVNAKSTFSLQKRITGITTMEKARALVCKFFETGQIPE